MSCSRVLPYVHFALGSACLSDAHAIQLVFSKTRVLSVKVATLVTFLSMVKTLDQVRVGCSPAGHSANMTC